MAGNHVQELINGDEIFPPMLAAIRAARKTITFETCIYWSGDIGREFAEALAERAQAGVKVHVLVDWIGSVPMDDELLDLMEDAGVELHKYHPLHWYHLARMNNCTHRKLLVVDGAVGFTGGVGIADEWLGDAQDADHWRDSHFRIEGPAVAHMQAAFLDPDDLSVETLVRALKRGVKVRISLPGKRIDSEPVRRASRALGRPARGRRRNPRIPAGHVSLQGDDRR